MALEIPSVISYDKLLESIQMKLEVGDIGNDTEYLADLIITLESRIRLTHAMADALNSQMGGAEAAHAGALSVIDDMA